MGGSEFATQNVRYVLWALVDGADTMRAGTVHSQSEISV